MFILIQFDEQKDQATVERILRVVFLDPENTSPVRMHYLLPASLFLYPSFTTPILKVLISQGNG